MTGKQATDIVTRVGECNHTVKSTVLFQGPQCTEKTEKMAKINPVSENTGNFGNFVKTQLKHREFGFSSCKFPDSKGKRYFNICGKNSKFSLHWISLPCQFCVCNSHKSHKLEYGKFAVGQRKNILQGI